MSVDITITGSGPVAMALTLFLHRQGIAPDRLHVAPVEAALPPPVAARSIALSEGSMQLLNRIIDTPPGASIEKVDIGVLGHGLHATLRPEEIGLSALGRVVRYRDLWSSLYKAFDALRAAGGCRTLHEGAAPADGLTLLADGRPGDTAARLAFDQVALTTELKTPLDSTALPLPGVAYERFKPNGPLALLPLPEPGRLSLVWCTDPARGDALAACNDAAFAHALATELGSRFSPFEVTEPRFVVPLQRLVDGHQPNASHTVRLGNAAQTLHPVAGQGLNLGLRDAFEASAIIGDKPDGVASQLARQIIAQRRRDRRVTIGVTDWLARLDLPFSSTGLNNGATQSIVIAMLDAIGPLRRSAARRFVFGHRIAN